MGNVNATMLIDLSEMKFHKLKTAGFVGGLPLRHINKLIEKIAASSAISLKMIKKGLQMARGEVSLEALMDFEIEACLTCVSTKERQASLEEFEGRKKE